MQRFTGDYFFLSTFTLMLALSAACLSAALLSV